MKAPEALGIFCCLVVLVTKISKFRCHCDSSQEGLVCSSDESIGTSDKNGYVLSTTVDRSLES
jgi:hypothetical protein